MNGIDRNNFIKKADNVIWLAFGTWRESRGESYECRLAVACSIMNRVNRPSWWGKDVLSVLFKKWQYSSLADPKDRQLTTWPLSLDPSWISCKEIAYDVLECAVANPVPGADSYFDDSIQAPKWATKETFVRKIGRVSFYNLDHDHEIEEAKNG